MPVNAFCATMNANGMQPCNKVSFTYVASFLATPASAVWYFDSGASPHMSGCLDDFASLRKSSGIITIAGGLKIPIEGKETVRLRCQLSDSSTSIAKPTNVLYSSELQNTRLFSWSYIRKHGYHFTATGDYLFVEQPNGRQIMHARIRNYLEHAMHPGFSVYIGDIWTRYMLAWGSN